MASTSESMTSTHSFAYLYRCFQKSCVKICETSKCHNFLIFQPIFIKFSLFCSKMFTISSEIKLNLFRISPLRKNMREDQHKPSHPCIHKSGTGFCIQRGKIKSINIIKKRKNELYVNIMHGISSI